VSAPLDLADFLRYWDNARGRTRRLVALIPPERVEWAPEAVSGSPGGARERLTCGDLVRHLAAIERWMFAENVSGRASRYPGHDESLASGVEALLAFHDRLHGEAMEVIGALTPDQLAARCETPGGASLPAWKWLRSMVEHEAHHRGQLYSYLGLLGVPTPPLYGLTEEEVKARSRPSEI
jgi:uncharacterized damage-inducible protein DinB